MEQRRGKPRTGKSTAVKLVKSCLQLLVQLLVGIWCDHNQAIYRSDKSGTTMQVVGVNTRVREIYDNHHIYPQFIRDTMFNMTLEQRLKQRPFQLVKWIETINVKHQTSLREETVYQYYHPTRPPEVNRRWWMILMIFMLHNHIPEASPLYMHILSYDWFILSWLLIVSYLYHESGC